MKRFSFMHNIFVYKKMNNAPDSLFKRFQKSKKKSKMKKKVKLK